MNNFIGAAQKRVAWLQTAVVLVPGLSAALGVDLVASAAGVCARFALLSALWLLLCWFRPGKPAVTPQDLVRVLVDLRNAGRAARIISDRASSTIPGRGRAVRFTMNPRRIPIMSALEQMALPTVRSNRSGSRVWAMAISIVVMPSR